MTLAEALKGLMWWRHGTEALEPEPEPEPLTCDPELAELRRQKEIADVRYVNGVEALRAMNRENVERLQRKARRHLQSAHELRRELKSEPGI